MKSLLTFIFNAARNISLLLVILFFCFAYYFEKHPEQAEKWLSETSEEVLYQQEVEENEEGEADFVSVQSFEIPESNRSAKKLTIPTKEGTAYLRPSQIMYTDTDTLVTTNLQKIAITSTLSRIHAVLGANGESCFFKTKNTILNCHYVMQVIRVSAKHPAGSYSYQDYVVMEDGKRIAVSQDKSEELKNLLEQLSI
jgi:hypothetical protein